MKPTFEQYLSQSFAAGIIDHSLRVSSDDKGNLSFYIHPDGKDGETADFVLIGNRLELPRKTVSEIKAEDDWKCPWCDGKLTLTRNLALNAEWFHCLSCGFESNTESTLGTTEGMLAKEARK